MANRSLGPKDIDFRAILSEFIGTTLFLYSGISIATIFNGPDAASKLIVSLVFGISAAGAINATAHTKGGQMNPAVTIAFAVSGYLPFLQTILNILIQCVAAIFASALVLGTTQDLTLSYNAVTSGVESYNALIGEIVLTFFLVFVILEICFVPEIQYGKYAPVTVGFVIFVSHGILTSIDGCSINPARSFGPALLEGVWDDFWIFVVGPIVGGLLAVLMHKILRAKNCNDLIYETGKTDPET